jgi:hypothetical protein
MSYHVIILIFFAQDFVGAGFCRGGTEQQRRAAMACEGCSIKFTVFKRKVSIQISQVEWH